LGDLLLCACAVLLALAVAHRADTVSTARAQARADKAVFSRYVQKLPGSFGAARINAGKTADVVCARKQPGGRGSRVCLLVQHATPPQFAPANVKTTPQWPPREA
jgi:hypothetical protein